MTQEQYQELMSQAPQNLPPEYLAVAHVYAAFLDGTKALGHVINHTLHDESLPPGLKEAGQALLDAIKEPMRVFESVLVAASDSVATPELREFAKKVESALQPQVTLSEEGVLDFSNKTIGRIQ